ncbi:MAG: lactate racemase domain-containing protein [Candidatus Latescibacteria bacterium]|jgi:nickel-dependent lactate racemase|nr:lactate racemase domain-containing protein [Candidatus Latescibacterota bacterium]
MQTIRVPWAAWYGTEKLELSFPDTWELTVAEMAGGDDIGDAGIREALDSTIGTPPLRELARGRSSAAILVDDLSRPTPAFRLLPYVLEELAEAGIPEDRVCIIGAVAAHRPMIRDDFVKKVGKDIVDRIQVLSHNAYGNVDLVGHSSRGVPIFINRDFMSREVRIAMGMITPRGGFFGGGCKLLLPGAAGHVTILANHRYVHEGFREHLAEVGRMAGLDFIVNPLLNADLDIISLVAGDPEAAYWEGVDRAKSLYLTPIPDAVDVAVCNAFPKDTELMQAGMALVPVRGTRERLLREDATVVIATASPEGFGWHTVNGPGAGLALTPSPPHPRAVIFSPNVNRHDVDARFGSETVLCRTWDEVIDTLVARHGDRPRVAVFPCAALQYGGE